jgi:hypothetical protein
MSKNLSLNPSPRREGLKNLPPLSWERGIRGGEARSKIDVTMVIGMKTLKYN